MSVISRLSKLVFSSAILLSIQAGDTYAQDIALEEIVVTAQRRIQSLQDVPISIDVVSGETILQEGFRDLEQLEGFSPGLRLSADTRDKTLLIRGIGTSGQNQGFEQSTAVFIDGIHFGRGSQIRNAFLDVEQVEVLKGPQPLFFGQNASGGALNITTRKPGSEWEGYSVGELGNNEMRMVEAAVGGPITETFGIRIAAKYDSTAGYLRNIWDGNPMPFRENKVVRATIKWTPITNLEITAKGEYLDQDTGGRASAIMLSPGTLRTTDITNINVPGGPFTSFASPAHGDLIPTQEFSKWGIGITGCCVKSPANVRSVGTGGFNVNNEVVDLSQVGADYDFLPGTASNPYHFVLNMDYELNNGIMLSSISGYAFDDRYEIITDDNNMPFFAHIRTKKDEKLDQWSQELRATSETGGTFEWMTGLYYQGEELWTLGDQHSAQVRAANFNHITQTEANQSSDWYSAFGILTFNFLDNKLSLDVGARATQVKKSSRAVGNVAFWLAADGTVANNQGVLVVDRTPIRPSGITASDSIKDDKVNSQIALRWRPTSDISFYAKYADAFKAGGFDLGVARLDAGRQDAYSFGPETSKAYEAGVKTTFWDSRAAAEVVAFTSTFTGLQLSGFDDRLARQVVRNAAEQKVEGIEFNGQVAVTEGLKLGIVGALLDGKVISYPGATCGTTENQAGLCTGPGGTIDRSGSDSLNTPDWDITLSANYWMPLLDRFKLSLSSGLNYKADYITTFGGGATKRGTHERLNLALGFGDLDSVWEVRAWVRNLTQPMPVYNAAGDVLPLGRIISPLGESEFRTYGVQVRYNIF